MVSAPGIQNEQRYGEPSRHVHWIDGVSVPAVHSTNPISAQEDFDRLVNVCKTGRGNAGLLREALVYAKPEDFDGELIQEFLTRCRTSQDLILSQIAWATAEAERSRHAAWTSASTSEERLLEELLGANEELLEALRMYDDLERVANETEVQEQSRLEQLVRQPVSPVSGFTATPEETSLVGQIFSIGDPGHSGLVSAPAAVKMFSGSGLSSSTLAKVWDIANIENKGGLDRRAVGIAVRLIGHAQQGAPVTEALLSKSGPLAHIETLSVPGPSASVVELPPLTEEDKAKFLQIFLASGPTNGMLSGPQAREVLLKSALPPTTLSQIWDLADVRHRGFLDQGDFTVAMYLVRAIMKGRLTNVPSSLPAKFYEKAGAMPPLSLSAQSTSGPSQMSNETSVSHTAMNSRASSYSPTLKWDITPAMRTTSDEIFETLDPQKKGYAAGDVVGTVLSQSGLPIEVLERIWDLSDTGTHGYLTRDEFAVALYLVQLKMSGKELPSSLPESLLPPTSDLRLNVHTSAQSLPTNDLLMDLSGLEFPTVSVPKVTLSMPDSSPTGALANGSNVHLTINTSLSHPSSPGPTSSSQGALPSPLVTGQNASAPGSAFRTPPASPLLAGSTSYRSPSAQRMSQIPSGMPLRLEIPETDRARFDGFFDTLDPWRNGYIDGDVAVPFFAKSKLPEDIMAEIWDLADMNGDGHLTRHEFTVAMHLIREKLRGKELPGVLPQSLRSSSPVVVSSARSPDAPELPPRPRPPPEVARAETRTDTPPPPYEAVALSS